MTYDSFCTGLGTIIFLSILVRFVFGFMFGGKSNFHHDK